MQPRLQPGDLVAIFPDLHCDMRWDGQVAVFCRHDLQLAQVAGVDQQ
jgi:hypothetical protein